MDHTAHPKSKKTIAAALKIAGFLAVELCAVLLVYFWRVFYYLDARGISPAAVTAGVCGVFGVLYLLALGLCRVRKDLPSRAAVCIFACGLLFCFANPPMQTPDETSHFLRSWRISEGSFVFDASHAYPDDVSRLVQAFPGAWVSAHTSQGIRPVEKEKPTPQTQPISPAEEGVDTWTTGEGWEAYRTQEYAMKQYGETGTVHGPADGFAQYWEKQPVEEPVTEPLNFAIFPYFATAPGIALARLLGFGALGCFYAGRIANLLVYTLLCFGALKRLDRMQPVFLAVMLLPMSLYMAASYNYDAIVLGCYYFAATFFWQRKWENKDAAAFCAVFLGMNIIKPWINLLWLAVLLFVPKDGWNVRLKRWQITLLCLAGAVVSSRIVDWYGAAFRYHYGTIGRQLGETVDQMGQLGFVLRNPLRYLAVLVGTLYENDLYLGQLGVFGAMDLPIRLVNLLSPWMLFWGAAAAVTRKKQESPLHTAGIGLWGLVYLAGALTAMYITWTPVGMVRVVGFQARYLLPVFLLWAAALSEVLSHGLQLRTQPDKAAQTALLGCGGFSVLSGVLLFQHYFIGPVFTI